MFSQIIQTEEDPFKYQEKAESVKEEVKKVEM